GLTIRHDRDRICCEQISRESNICWYPRCPLHFNVEHVKVRVSVARCFARLTYENSTRSISKYSNGYVFRTVHNGGKRFQSPICRPVSVDLVLTIRVDSSDQQTPIGQSFGA